MKATKDESRYTISRLSVLAKMERRSVEQALHGLPTKGGLTLAEFLPRLVHPAEDVAAKKRLRDLKEREQAARTDSAEMDSLAKAKKICLQSTALLFVSETRIAIRQCVERTKHLSPLQKTRLLTELAALKIPPPPEPTTEI